MVTKWVSNQNVRICSVVSLPLTRLVDFNFKQVVLQSSTLLYLNSEVPHVVWKVPVQVSPMVHTPVHVLSHN